VKEAANLTRNLIEDRPLSQSRPYSTDHPLVTPE
jgi:hypothetical protein